MDTDTCGCDRRVRYSIFKDGKEIGACNKYMRCLTYEEQGAALAKANTEAAGLQQRLSAAEKERDETIAWGNRLKSGLEDATERLEEDGYTILPGELREILAASAPAALSHLRQEIIERCAISCDVKAASILDNNRMLSAYVAVSECAAAIRRLAEEQEGKK